MHSVVRGRRRYEMFVRFTSIYCEDSRVDDAITVLEEIDRPAVEAAAGHQGLRTLVDRRAAVLVAASYWDAPEFASDATLTQARWAAAEAAGGELTTDTWEVAARLHTRPPSTATVLQMYCAPRVAEFTALTAMMTGSIFPLLATCAGMCQAELLLDHETGAAFLATEWEHEAQLRPEGIRETRGLLDHVREKLDVEFSAVGDYGVIGESWRSVGHLRR